MDQVLKTVEWLLDCLTLESIDHCCVAIASCTKSASILKGVVFVIHNRAVHEEARCSLYAKLCSNLDEKLPRFPLEEAYGQEIQFRRILINKCQEAFESDDEMKLQVDQDLECSDKERFIGNIRLIGELWKQKIITEAIVHIIIEKLLGTDREGWPAARNIEAIWQLFRAIGKQLDEYHGSRLKIDVYMSRLNELAIKVMGDLRLWFMVRSIVLLRADNWESNPQAVRTSLPPNNNQDDALKRKITTRLLEEYFKETNVGRASRCIEELNSSFYHTEIIKEVISTGLEKSPPRTEQVSWLLEYLLAKKVITIKDVADGCVSYGSSMDNVGTCNPIAPHGF